MSSAAAIAEACQPRSASESAPRGPAGWYVRPALGVRSGAVDDCLSCLGLAALLLAGCGGERQDENEPSGDFPVEVVDATFPEAQKLAQSTKLVITLRNAGDETIPNLGVSVEGFDYQRTTTPAWPIRSRPVFASNGGAGADRRLPRGQGRQPTGLRLGLRQHRGHAARSRPAGRRPSLVGHRGQGRRTSSCAGRSSPACTARPGAVTGRRRRRAAVGLVQRHDLARAPQARVGRGRQDRGQRRRADRAAARGRGSARPADAGTWRSGRRSWSAGRARTCCRAPVRTIF